MRPDEVDLAVDWAADEGWNPGLHDAQPFSLVDPDGFLIGLPDDEPVATISAVRYGAGFGFLGFYIVVPGHRSKGLGLELWNAALDRLGSRTIGLVGVVAQQENYRRGAGPAGRPLVRRHVLRARLRRPPSRHAWSVHTAFTRSQRARNDGPPTWSPMDVSRARNTNPLVSPTRPLRWLRRRPPIAAG